MKTVMMILSMIPELIKAISAVEKWCSDNGIGSGYGAEKLGMVKDAMTIAYDGIAEAMPVVEKVISRMVAFANTVGIFKKGDA